MTRRAGSDWHLTAEHAAGYATGSLAEPDAWSVEKHVEVCTACAVRVSDAVRAGAAGPTLDRLRASVLSAIAPDAAGAVAEAPDRPGAVGLPGPTGVPSRPADVVSDPADVVFHPADVRGAAGRETGDATGTGRFDRLDRPGWLGRGSRLGDRGSRLGDRSGWLGGRVAALAWAAGPALRGPWLASLLVMAVIATASSRTAGFDGARSLLLALAPALPLVGVAMSYGRRADPLHEVTASTPSGGLRLLLARTATVLAVSVPLVTLTGALLPSAAGSPGAAAWLLPGLALTLAALVLGSYVGCRRAALGLCAGWLLAVGVPTLAAPAHAGSRMLASGALSHSTSLATVLSGPAAQGSWAAAAAVCAGLLVLRRASFDHLERL